MSLPSVSIIIPVYNAAQYLSQCLSSIQAQSFRNFEVLMVNDGSTDASQDICRSFAESDSRFFLFDQENSGVSVSRNRALLHARGKYLQFIDSDDWLTDNAVETLFHGAESAGSDLTVCHFYRVLENHAAQRGHIKTDKLLTRCEYAKEMMKAPANYYYGVLWNKLYRRSLVENAQLQFDPQIKWGEDFLFNLQYLEHVRLVSAVAKPIYYYRKREDSLVNSHISLRKTILMKKNTFRTYKELYQKLDLYEEQRGHIFGYFLSAAVDGAITPLAPKLDP